MNLSFSWNSGETQTETYKYSNQKYLRLQTSTFNNCFIFIIFIPGLQVMWKHFDSIPIEHHSCFIWSKMTSAFPPHNHVIEQSIVKWDTLICCSLLYGQRERTNILLKPVSLTEITMAQLDQEGGTHAVFPCEQEMVQIQLSGVSE